MAPDDISSVVPLFLSGSQTRFWEGGKPHDAESAAEMLGRYFRLPSYHWVASKNNDIAAYAHLLRSDFLDSWIVSYIVAEEFQGEGIAKVLVAEAKDFARDAGIESLYASVHPANLASIRVIEKSGFEPSQGQLYRWLPQKRD